MDGVRVLGEEVERQAIRVLHVEDNPGDSILLVEALFEIQGSSFSIVNVPTLQESLKRLDDFDCDVILLDMSLPDSVGIETLKSVHNAAPEKPIIILTGSDDQEMAFDAVAYGAQDYLLKGKSGSSLIARTIRYAIDRKKALLELAHCAKYDTLTGLANRSLFRDRLQQAITRTERNHHSLALVFLDLDRFKQVNDELGHGFGDTLLRETANRLLQSVRKQDTVARLGGDEFTIVLEDVQDEMSVSSLCEKIILELAQPYSLNGTEVVCSASLGVSMLDDKHTVDADTLIKHADMAMYNAKKQGRNNVQFFSQSMNAALRGQIELEKHLRIAVKSEEFFLEYQPQIQASSGRLLGAEALIRWQHPDKGVVPPASFIPMLEKTGLIIPVGEWVLRTACQQWMEWIAAEVIPADALLSVNISAQQFKQKDLVLMVSDALQNAGMPARQLTLELTENALLKNNDTNIKVLSAIKDTGVQLSIDDFGTGYSSLSYLKQFPVDSLKVDRSFVQDIMKSRGDAAIAASIIDLAGNLGLTVIAEGVDSMEKLNLLQGYGCQTFQGYLFGKPSINVPCESYVMLH